MNKIDKTIWKIKCSSPFHIAKRDNIVWWKAWLIRLAAIVLALGVCAIITIALTKIDPMMLFSEMFKGAMGTKRRIWFLLQNTAILLCISLAVTPAFKMKFWNIGAEGQVLIGGLATAACVIYFGDTMSPALLMTIMVVSSIIAGAVWGLLPAIFKARFNTNETLFTLMMNYIAIQLVKYFTLEWSIPKGTEIPRPLEYGHLPVIAGQQYLFNILIVVAITILMYIYLKYSKHGYEISVVGESENTAKYIGINVKKVILRTMAISGALCGLAGLLLVAGTNHSIKNDMAGGRGFTAIMVSWLAKFNPIYMVLTSFLIVFLEEGSKKGIVERFDLNNAFADIITGIIIFFIIGSEFFINYTIKRNKK